MFANFVFSNYQVTWDEPEVLQNVRAVSPWQVELVSTCPPYAGTISCNEET